MFTVRGSGIDYIREFAFSCLKNVQGGTIIQKVAWVQKEIASIPRRWAPAKGSRARMVGVTWDLSVKKIDAGTCEFTNVVHSSFTPELLDSLARQGIPREVFQSARKPVSEAHNRQETPLFANSIERHALSNTSSAAMANA